MYGFFAWGIGSAIVKPWQQLSTLESQPMVVFSKIKGQPRTVDVAPSSLLLWQEWERDGKTQPTQGLITSQSVVLVRTTRCYAAIFESALKESSCLKMFSLICYPTSASEAHK